MISRWQWVLRHVTRRLYFRASLLSVLAIFTALVAIVLKPYIPTDIPAKIGAEAVDNILSIIASSMLAVTTFSLSTMVAAFSAATSNVTPRATSLLIEDTTTQNALATFIGSFLYSLVGIIALSTGAYGEQGRAVLFVVTLFVIGLIVATLLRWIDHLARLGRVGETTERVERAAMAAIRARVAAPFLGGEAARDGGLPGDAQPVFDEAVGYVQHVDMGRLARIARDHGARIELKAVPGIFVHPTRPLAILAGGAAETAEAVRGAFSIGDSRSFDQDPRFGVIVLSEIGSRALSPAVNDPGTAIDVVGRGLRVLLAFAVRPIEAAPVDYPGVFVPALSVDDLVEDFFAPLIRDGASTVEVTIRIRKALAALQEAPSAALRAAAERQDASLMKRAETALAAEDFDRLTRAIG